MLQAPQGLARLLWAALNRYIDADGMRQGAAVSFYAAFSIAPLLVVVTGVMVCCSAAMAHRRHCWMR